VPHKDPIKRAAYHFEYRQKQRVKGIPANNPETLAAYRENNREKRKTYNRAYYLAHTKETDAVNRAWREAHPEIVKRNTAAYRQSFRGRYVSSICAAARKRGLPVFITFDQYVLLVKRNHCAYCGGALPPAGGGLDRKNSKLGYTWENCVACCRVCNEIRGHDNVTYEEMIEVSKLLRKLRKKNEATRGLRSRLN
jgi:hypothetical protein